MPPKVELLFTGSDQGAAATAVSVQDAVTGMAAGAERANQSLSTGLGATVLEFQRVDQGVQQLTTDFEAGLLSQQEWEKGLAAARAEAIALRQATGDLSGKELRAFGGVLDKTAGASGAATFKLDLLKNGMRQMAQQAAGAQGPIGNLVSSVLQMAGGSEAVVGAAAGIGVIMLILRALTSDAQKAAKATQDAIDRLLHLKSLRLTDQQKQEQDIATARAELDRVTANLAADEKFLAEQRRLRTASDGVIAVTEARLNAELERQQQLLIAINEPEKLRQARAREDQEKAYQEAVKAVTARLGELAVRVAFVGRTRDELSDALLRQELAQRNLSAAEIDSLVLKEREARALEQELANRKAILDLMVQMHHLRVAEVAAPGLRGLKPPTEKLPAPAGQGTVDGGPMSQADLLAHQMVDSFGLSIDMVDELGKSLDNLASGALTSLGDAFETVFDAIIAGGKVSGDQMVKGLLGAISKAAIHEGAFYFARGIAALAGAIFPVPDPKNAVSAGQYFHAAALMGAVGLGTGLAASAIGGAADASHNMNSLRDSARAVQENRASGDIVIVGDWWPGDPSFVDKLAVAVREMIDRGVTDVVIRRAEDV